MSATLRTVRTVGDRKVAFTWRGGPYIELGWVGRQPAEVINVWDYERDVSRVPFTGRAFRRAVTDWIAEHDGLGAELAEAYRY